jgi:hypothetical protein
LAGLAAATSRALNTFEGIARSDQFKEILNRVCEHRDRPQNAAIAANAPANDEVNFTKSSGFRHSIDF